MKAITIDQLWKACVEERKKGNGKKTILMASDEEGNSDRASHQLCRLIVLNTASIQFLPTNVAAVRSALGCAAPFDILGPVWITSLLSAGLGVTAAVALGRVWKR